MAADFVDHISLPGVGHNEWIRATCATMAEKGVTFVRVGHPPDDPDELYFEGWLVRPNDQGSCPWEA